MGKVNAVYEIRKTREKNEDYANKISEKAFLYSSFDGEKMIYKLYLPVAEKAYDVMTSPSYTGEDIKWSHNGKISFTYPHSMKCTHIMPALITLM